MVKYFTKLMSRCFSVFDMFFYKHMLHAIEYLKTEQL